MTKRPRHHPVTHTRMVGNDPRSGPEDFRVFPIVMETSVFKVYGLAAIHPSWLTFASLCNTFRRFDDGLSLVFRRIAVIGRVTSAVETRIILGVISRRTGRGHQHVLEIYIL